MGNGQLTGRILGQSEGFFRSARICHHHANHNTLVVSEDEGQSLYFAFLQGSLIVVLSTKLDDPPPYSESYIPPPPPSSRFPHLVNNNTTQLTTPFTKMTMATPPDASQLVTQVADPNALAARAYLEAATRGEDDDVYCIYSMRGVRRDLKRREAKLIPDPLAVHLKNGHIHVPWEQLQNWPWIAMDQTVGDDWEYRAIPVFDVPISSLRGLQ